MSFHPPGYCPNCGEYVEEGAVACPSCGSCEETGWNDDSLYDGLDLPNDDDGNETEKSRREGRLLGAIVSLFLLAVLIYVFVLR